MRGRILILMVILTSFDALSLQNTNYNYELELGADNDKFIAYTTTDRNYTYGINAALRWRPKTDTFFDKLFSKDEGNHLGIGVNIKAFTPNYIDESATKEASIERPFAGWSYLTFKSTHAFRKSFFSMGLEAGILGPSSHVGQIQNWFHETISNDATVNWETQISDQLGINIIGNYSREIYSAGWLDTYAQAQASLGNIHTYVWPQLNFRVGQFNPIGSSVGTQNGILSQTGKSEFFLEYGLGGKLSGYNATVQGNMFKDDARALKEINHLVFTMNTGLHLSFQRLAILVRYLYGSGEFERTQRHRYGAIRLLYRFR